MWTTVWSTLPLAPTWTWQVGSPGGTLGKGEQREVWGFILLTPFLRGPLELLCPSPDSHWSSQAAYTSLISVNPFFSALHLPSPASYHSGHRDGEQHGDCQIQIIWIPRLSMALLSCTFFFFFCFFFYFLVASLMAQMVKHLPAVAGDLGSIPGSGRSPGEGNGNPLQYSCLENPMYGGAWWATVHGVTKSRARLSDFTLTFISYFNFLLEDNCCTRLCWFLPYINMN